MEGKKITQLSLLRKRMHKKKGKETGFTVGYSGEMAFL